MSNVVVSYYKTYEDALNQENRHNDSFPKPENIEYGRDGILNIQEVGINLLLDYGLIDNKDNNSIIIMYIQEII